MKAAVPAVVGENVVRMKCAKAGGECANVNQGANGGAMEWNARERWAKRAVLRTSWFDEASDAIHESGPAIDTSQLAVKRLQNFKMGAAQKLGCSLPQKLHALPSLFWPHGHSETVGSLVSEQYLASLWTQAMKRLGLQCAGCKPSRITHRMS